MSDEFYKCDGCGSLLEDGGVDWFCPNAACDYEQLRATQMVAEWNETRERAEYERLKAKFA